MIDYVVPMVFPDDKEWQADLRRAGGDMKGFNLPRYRSWGTEELLIRCVRKFMPWVRHIFILLARDSQVQPWMVEACESLGARIVFHRDFIPEKYLPTFNSRAMEMFLHRIPGLSERFLYGNDDMIPLSPLAEEDFFVGEWPCQHMYMKDYPADPNNFQMACMHGLNFVARHWHQQFKTKWLKNGHSIAPYKRSTCLELWKEGKKEIQDSITPFRRSNNFNQYIYAWYQHFSRKYIDRLPPHAYHSVKDPLSDILADIERPDCGVVCINDHEAVEDITQIAEAVKKAIERKINDNDNANDNEKSN